MSILTHQGEFISRKGERWGVQIFCDYDQTAGEVAPYPAELTFDADSPLVIDWAEMKKDEVFWSSTATLTIESPGDRTYAGLYTIRPGAVRIRVYRGGLSGRYYWGGYLDPEFYEEPYERADKYNVSLTFSDFGILSRKKFNPGGRKLLSIKDIFDLAGFGSLDVPYVSSIHPGTESDDAPRRLDIEDIYVQSDNFIDEDGEEMSMRDVIEGVLRPLGLHLAWRGGRLALFDLNGLHQLSDLHMATGGVITPVQPGEDYTPRYRRVHWSGDKQTMGTDVVYNNVKITYSPYARKGNLMPEKVFDDDAEDWDYYPDWASPEERGDFTVACYPAVNSDRGGVGDNSGFTLWTSLKSSLSADGWTRIRDVASNFSTRFFKLHPLYSGNDAQGVAVHWATNFRGNPKPHGTSTAALDSRFGQYAGATVLRTPKIWLPATRNWRLRITLPLLLDFKFNPFESGSGCKGEIVYLPHSDAGEMSKVAYDFDAWEEEWNKYGGYVYVPVIICFKSDSNGKTYLWTNKDVIARDPQEKKNTSIRIYDTYGEWIEDPDTDRDKVSHDFGDFGYLAYYDQSFDGSKCGVLNGWKNNRQAIMPYAKPKNNNGLRPRMTLSIAKAEEGQLIAPPPAEAGSGQLWIEICDSWLTQIAGEQLGTIVPHQLIKKRSCWALCQMPRVETVLQRAFNVDMPDEDIEYNTVLNVDAKEPLNIDTICGSLSTKIAPVARGTYFYKDANDNYRPLTLMRREELTGTVEELLAATIYSQHAARHTTLSGEMDIALDMLAGYQEDNQSDRVFMIVADTQNLIQDTSEVKLCELSPDEYTPEDTE